MTNPKENRRILTHTNHNPNEPMFRASLLEWLIDTENEEDEYDLFNIHKRPLNGPTH